MKILLILMIILSVAVGIPINGGDKGWLSLWGPEFSYPVSMIIKSGTSTFSLPEIILWIMLLIAHIGVISLPFLTHKSYFNSLLIGAPLAFILIFIVFASIFIIIVLIPFIIVWIVALLSRKREPSWW
jgi:hypothetical protein